MNKKKILFIHHHPHFGGATRSFGKLMNEAKVFYDVKLISPTGTALDFYKNNKIPTIEVKGLPIIDISYSGYYRGFRWFLLLREFYFYFHFCSKILFLKYEYFDIVHINEFFILPILPIIKFKFRCKKIVIHLRATLINQKSFLKNLSFQLAKKYVSKIIAIDKLTKNQLPPFLKKKTEVVYNPQQFILKNIKKKFSQPLKFGFVGPANEDKGFEHLIKIAKICLEMKLNVKFIVFSNFSSSFMSFLLHFFKIKKNYHYFVKKNYFFLNKNIIFRGYTKNIKNIYKLFDINLSIQEPGSYGRSIIESASFGLPSLLWLRKNYNEAIKNYKTGFLAKYNNLNSVVAGINYFVLNKKNLKKIGKNNYFFFKRKHDEKKYFSKINKIYKNL